MILKNNRCGGPLQFRNINAGYFPTCGNQECKQKAVAVGEINRNYKTIDQKLKDAESDTKKSVYTRSERCWDALMDKLTEMGFVYKDNYDEVFTLECMNCGTIFEKTRNDINLRYNARRWGMCPKCQIKDSTYRSSFEKDVCAVLNEIVGADIQIFTNKYINNYEVDINIPDLKIAVECNGLYWHSELCKDKDYHIQKKLAVESTGYLLVYIWENEWYYNQETVIENLRKICAGEEVTGSYNYCRMPADIDMSEPEFWWFNKNHRQPKRYDQKPESGLYYRGFGLPAYKEKVAD